MLMLANVTGYLLDRQLVSAASVANGEFKVTDVSGRHRNLTVTTDNDGFFLKQGASQAKAAAIQREAEVYRLLHSGATTDAFTRYLPRLISYDERQHALVLERIENARNLREYHSRQGRFPLIVARTTGKAVGVLHKQTNETTSECITSGNADLPPPWILSLHRPGLGLFQEASGANLELIKVVQQFPRFGELLDELQKEWRQTAFIHRDLKWDNCLFRTGRVRQGESSLKIIDWELAGLGDPCWDVGSVFNDYLNFWLLSIPATGEIAPPDFLSLARYPLEKMHPALRALWSSYKEQMQLDGPTEQLWQTRSVRYAAARLLQTVFEQMQVSTYLTGNAICSLQVSLNMLERPGEAAIRLLGLSPPGAHPQ
jgi:thiamine kinase-like enzyme